MNTFLNIVFFLVGSFVGTFVLGNIILVLFFSIPFTKRLSNMGVVTNKKAISTKNLLTIVIQLILCGIIVSVVYFFFNKYMTLFLIGLILSVIFTFFRSGDNTNNIEDYLNTNHLFIDVEKLTELLENKNI